MTGIQIEQIAGMNQHYQHYSLDFFFRIQQELGLKSVELWLGAPHFYLDCITCSDCAVVRRKAANRGLRIVSSTTPSFAWQYQCAAPEPELFRRSLEYFAGGIRASAAMGASIMTVNSGWGYAGESWESGAGRTAEMLWTLSELARREGILLALESLTSCESSIGDTLDRIKRLINAVNHPSLKVMIDTVAVVYAGETISMWFDAFGKEVIHMHFVDANTARPTDDHYIWGEGTLPLERTLAELGQRGYRGYLVQEVVAGQYYDDPAVADRNNIKTLRRYLR